MPPIHKTHTDDPVLMTANDCKEAHSERNKFAMWVVGLLVAAMLALATSAWAYISGAIRQGAEHEIRLQHLETTVQKIDRMDDKLNDIRRITDEINRKK